MTPLAIRHKKFLTHLRMRRKLSPTGAHDSVYLVSEAST